MAQTPATAGLSDRPPQADGTGLRIPATMIIVRAIEVNVAEGRMEDETRVTFTSQAILGADHQGLGFGEREADGLDLVASLEPSSGGFSRITREESWHGRPSLRSLHYRAKNA